MSSVWCATQPRRVHGFLARLDSNGRLVFSYLPQVPDFIDVTAITRFRGGVAFTGTLGTGGAVIVSFDPSAERIDWTRRIGKTDGDRLSEIGVLSDQTVVAAGETTTRTCRHAGRHAWLIALSQHGDLRSDYCVGGVRIDAIQGLVAAEQHVWLKEMTDSPDFPLTAGGPGTRSIRKYRQAFLMRVDPVGEKIIESFLLGTDEEPRRHYVEGHAITRFGGHVFVTGEVGPSFGNRVPSGVRSGADVHE